MLTGDMTSVPPAAGTNHHWKVWTSAAFLRPMKAMVFPSGLQTGSTAAAKPGHLPLPPRCFRSLLAERIPLIGEAEFVFLRCHHLHSNQLI